MQKNECLKRITCDYKYIHKWRDQTPRPPYVPEATLDPDPYYTMVDRFIIITT